MLRVKYYETCSICTPRCVSTISSFNPSLVISI